LLGSSGNLDATTLDEWLRAPTFADFSGDHGLLRNASAELDTCRDMRIIVERHANPDGLCNGTCHREEERPNLSHETRRDHEATKPLIFEHYTSERKLFALRQRIEQRKASERDRRYDRETALLRMKAKQQKKRKRQVESLLKRRAAFRKKAVSVLPGVKL
jgi:hypothetical protein